MAVTQQANVVFRALGLGILTCWFRSLFSQTKYQRIEPPKVAIRKHRPSALLGALIHAIPVSGAIALVSINLYEYYIPRDSAKTLVFYQLLAKIHEIAIQASIAAIVFSYIRHEMVLGQGIPFGSLFCGLQVSQASYLWSMEFWGSVRSKHLNLRRCGLIAITVGAVVLATVAGPSSAILLVPHITSFPWGSTHIWINTTPDGLWPTRTDRISVPAACSRVYQSPQPYSCPSDEWQSIGNYFRLLNDGVPQRYQKDVGALGPNRVQVTGKASIRHLEIEHLQDHWGDVDSKTTIATTPQAAVADALITVSTIWSQAFENITTAGHGKPMGLEAGSSIGKGYYQPYTVGTCAQYSMQDAEDERPLDFPAPPWILPEYIPEPQVDPTSFEPPTFPFPGLTQAEALNFAGPSSENRLRWVELPRDPFNGSAIGAVILLAEQASGSETSQGQEIITCTLGAGWGSSNLNTSAGLGGGHGEVISFVNHTAAMSVAQLVYSLSKKENGGSVEDYLQATRDFLLPLYPDQTINISESWSRYLNPTVADLNTTVFHHLMQGNITSREPRVSAGIILSSLLANGLSRIGIESSLQGDLRRKNDSNGDSVIDANSWWRGKGDAFIVDPSESNEWVKLKLESFVTGYAYTTIGFGPKIAVAFMLIYIIFAAAHTCYAGISGISSSCWDSIGEVAALTMNSAPTTLLRNTSAGITETNIFKLPARIVAKPDDASEGEHLELVLGEHVEDKMVESRTMKVNQVYG